MYIQMFAPAVRVSRYECIFHTWLVSYALNKTVRFAKVALEKRDRCELLQSAVNIGSCFGYCLNFSALQRLKLGLVEIGRSTAEIYSNYTNTSMHPPN
jgi:hypothetical protein